MLNDARECVDRLMTKRRNAEIAASDALKKFLNDTCSSHQYSIDAMRAFIMTHRTAIHGILNDHFSVPGSIVDPGVGHAVVERMPCQKPLCMNKLALTGEKVRVCTVSNCGNLVKDETPTYSIV